MPAKRKYATEEERKDAIKQQRKAYEKRNPEILKAKRLREKLKGRANRASDQRTCKICNEVKHVSAFAPNGGGFLYVCMACRPDTIPKALSAAKSPGNEVKTKVCTHCGINKPIDV